jgi:hypothetical protein
MLARLASATCFACVVLVELGNLLANEVGDITVPANSFNRFLLSCLKKVNCWFLKSATKIKINRKLTTDKSGWATRFPFVLWPATSFDKALVGDGTRHFRTLWRYI